MRLTDDYLIMTDNQVVLKELIDNLFKCANENNFSFNKEKLKSNF